MAQLIDKDVLVAEIKERIKTYNKGYANGDDSRADALEVLLHDIDTLEVKEVDIDKLCEFRKNIGFAYPEGASEYQKQLACYRQGIKDVIKAQKGE